MALLDDLGGLLGGNAALGGALKDVLTQSGGLDGLVAKFGQAGLGDVISGWISTGPNPPIGAGQLEQVLGSGAVRDLAARFGLPVEDLLGDLSAALPGAVDGLTPDGVAPAGGDISGALGGLLGRIFG